MKSTILCFTLLLSSLVYTNSYSQNLVPNGSFEDYTALPNSTSDWELCVGWNNVNMNLGNWPYATPDYLHTAGSGDAQLPNCKWANVTAQDGSAIMGLYSKHSSQTNSRDYIATQLTSPLVVGTTYTISFWMSSGSGNYYYGSSSSHMGVQLSMAPLNQVTHENTGGIPQAEITANPWNTGWVFYTFSYVATNAYQYVTIGNFYTDAATTTTLHAGSANYPAGSYYFIDDVVIEPSGGLPIELVSFEAENERDFVQTSWETISEINNDFFTVEHSEDTQNWGKVGIIDGAGNSIETQNYSLKDLNPYSGISYYRLKQTDFDGTESYSEIRSVSRFNGLNGDVKLFPNPTRDYVTVIGDYSEISEFKIYDVLGKDISDMIITKRGSEENMLILNLSNIPSGMYTLKTKNTLQKLSKI